MKIEDEITVMATYKPLLHILTIYDWKNFQHQDRRTVFSNLLQAIAVSASAFGYFICLLCDAWYCIEHSFNVTKVAMQMALFISALQLAIAYITIRINNERVNDAISAINRIVTERCDLAPKRFPHYNDAEKRFTLFTSIGTKIPIFTTAAMFGASFLIPLSYVIFDYPQPNQWTSIFGFHVAFPGEASVFFQYYLDLIAQILSVMLYYVMLCTIALFFIGMCIYIGGMVEDLKLTLAELEGDTATATNRLSTEIAHHNQMLDIAKCVGEIMSVGLFFQLLVSAVSLAIYLCDIESNGYRSASFPISITGLIATTTTTYVYCFLSEFVTYKLSDVGDHFYNCAWYRLPVKQQKFFILPIQRAQVEFRITGLGFVECSLRVFSSIMRATWSYFLLMHGSK